jgi:hypothetical protein
MAKAKSYTQIAGEVQAGKWGEGDERNEKLAAKGYDPEFVAKLVDAGVGKRFAKDESVSTDVVPPVAPAEPVVVEAPQPVPTDGRQR